MYQWNRHTAPGRERGMLNLVKSNVRGHSPPRVNLRTSFGPSRVLSSRMKDRS